MNKFRIIVKIILVIVVLGAGFWVCDYLLKTAPRIQPGEEPRTARIVQTIRVTPRSQRVNITVYGQVIPARTVILKSQVSGRIITQHDALHVGGYLSAGEEVIIIDRADYELDLAERKTALEEASFELEVEKGRQVVAAHEWDELKRDLVTEDVNRALVLREPHLRRAEAMVEKAMQQIAKAELALSRTAITSPFNAIVLNEAVEVGQLVNTGDHLCTLVGADEFWVQTTIPFADLNHIEFPHADRPGADAMVTLDIGGGQRARWEGKVLRMLADLETDSRMARVVVRVMDPLGFKTHERHKLPLLLGNYARVEIAAGTIADAIAIPRAALREGNRIWVVGADNTLRILAAEILWMLEDMVLIASAVEPHDQLIVSDLKSVLPGMKVAPQLLPENGNE